jgi:hypothetical protein
MKLLKSALLFLIILLASSYSLTAPNASIQPLSHPKQRQQNEKLFAPMTFSYHATDPYHRTGRFYILAEGVITSETPSQFLTFFKSLDRGLPTIYFNSPGGDLKAGLRLGRVIRELGLDTFVGGPYRSCFESDQKGRETNLASLDKEGGKASDLFAEEETCQHCTYSCDSPTLVSKEGICFSACAYAFLGGAGREVGENGIYGVHQFRSRTGSFRESDTQIAMTVLATYLDEMVVDRKLLDLASITPSGDIEPITPDVARKLKIDNYNPPIGEWEIEVSRSGQLFAFVTQRLPGRDAQLTFFLSRKGNQYLGSIRYSFHQSFRTQDEIADAFSTNKPPQVSGERYTSRLRVTEWWKPQRDGSYTISFLLDVDTLKKMSQESSFTFDSQFPNVYSDLLPYVALSTSRFQRILTALQRQR